MIKQRKAGFNTDEGGNNGIFPAGKIPEGIIFLAA
jgi:hypothetical protein